MEFIERYGKDASAIDALQPNPSDDVSDRARVMAMASNIHGALARGVTWTEIERCLRGLGVTVGLPAIKNYVVAAGIKSPPRQRRRPSPIKTARRNPLLSAMDTRTARVSPTIMKSTGASIQSIHPDSDDL